MRGTVFFLLFSLGLLTTNAVWALDYTADLFIEVGEEYNDNIFLTPDKVDDFITYITPGINFSAKSATSALHLAYSPTFNLYSSHSDQNNTAHHLTASGRFALSPRLNLTITDNFTKSSEVQDIGAIQDFGPIRRRTEVTANTASGDVLYKLSGSLTYSLGATYAISDSEAPDSSDVKTYTGRMALSYAASDRTSVSANVAYSKYDFSLGNDSDTQTYTITLNSRVLPTMTMGITGGVSITKTQDAGQNSGFSGGATITKTFEGQGSATLSFSQSVVPSSEEAQTLRNQTVSFNLSKPLTARLAASLLASYSKYKSIEGTGTDIDEARLSADLTYRLIRWIDLRLRYAYINHNDKIDNALDYRNNIIALTLRFSYSTRPGISESQTEPRMGR